MSRTTRLLTIPMAAVLLAGLGAAPWSGDGDEVELDEAKVFIEFNSTDEDLGIQLFWDGDAWKRMTVEGPNGKMVLDIKVRKNLGEQGLTEGFFESDEPSFDELPMDEFFERFPEGTYEFEGTTLEHEYLTGEAEFTHTLPAPPENLSPAEGDMVDSRSPLVLSFDAVTEDLDGEPLTPEHYEVVLETEGDILRIFSIILPGDRANPSVSVPAEFLEPDTEYKLEVIVQEESGNRTISETTFTTF
jgi:hypothetical protein